MFRPPPRLHGPRPRRRFRLQLITLQLAIVLLTVLAVAAIVLRFEELRTRELAFEEVHTVATEIASVPEVIATVNAADAVERIQPIAHLAERAAGVEFVVVADRDGIRVAHPDPAQIGQPVSSDHAPIRAGETFRGTEEGPLGVSLRSKVPIWDGDEVVGTVSVGLLQSEIRGDLLEVVLGFAPWVLLAAGLGTAGAAWASRYVRTRIYGAGPEEMAGLHQSRQALLHSVGDGVIGVDEDGTITLVNDEATRLLGVGADVEGRSAAEVLDADLAALLGPSPTPAPTSAPTSATGKAADAGPRRTTADEADWDLTTFALAGERILLARVRPARAQGRQIGRTLTVQDRTELESSLRELEGQRSLTETLRSQTHEFSNRLHVISGLLSLGETEEAQEYIRGLTGLAGGPFQHDLSDASLSALVGAKSALAREAGVVLELTADGSVEADWRADDDALTVVANLLTNAIEAAGDGGRVMLEVTAGAAGFAVQVDDSGPGLDPEAAQTLFRWGASTKDTGPASSRPAGGRGIGLALVDRIARRRHGRVEVTPSPWGGARFRAAWPAAAGTGTGTGTGTGDDAGTGRNNTGTPNTEDSGDIR
ncbi:sensor histidine kinase [Citricoccus zhacaiensis]|uniref:sensor histidine kinase n=1 Tax=Citricoccus zhacaiensis TaxID=489142 RepID=UPI00166449C2|nr:ATP-binding protein [Citricoccus zhacaiensis]